MTDDAVDFDDKAIDLRLEVASDRCRTKLRGHLHGHLGKSMSAQDTTHEANFEHALCPRIDHPERHAEVPSMRMSASRPQLVREFGGRAGRVPAGVRSPGDRLGRGDARLSCQVEHCRRDGRDRKPPALHGGQP